MSQLAVPVSESIQPSVQEAPGWLVLSIDNLRLAVPQKDAKTIELASSLEVAVEGEMEAGWLDQDGNMWPAYCLDDHLALKPEAPRSRRFCIMFREGEKLTGLLCDQIRMLPSDNDLTLQDIPECLVSEDSPYQWIALLDGKVVAAAESGTLARYMSDLEVRYGAD